MTIEFRRIIALSKDSHLIFWSDEITLARIIILLQASDLFWEKYMYIYISDSLVEFYFSINLRANTKESLLIKV